MRRRGIQPAVRREMPFSHQLHAAHFQEKVQHIAPLSAIWSQLKHKRGFHHTEETRRSHTAGRKTAVQYMISSANPVKRAAGSALMENSS
jgi:hypothetical protein